MKDYLGNEINIGDKVLKASGNRDSHYFNETFVEEIDINDKYCPIKTRSSPKAKLQRTEADRLIVLKYIK
jgi:hypothetical protein